MKSLAIAAALMAATGLVNAGETKGMQHDHSAMSAPDNRPKGVHKTVGVVRKVDARAGTASVAHEAVKALNWPAMTMSFKVQDKAALDKLAEGRKVEFEFEQRGKDYVITSVK